MMQCAWSRMLLFACTLLASGCSTAEEQALEQKRADLAIAEADVGSAQNRCTELTIAYNKADGAASLGEWDEAAAANVDHVSSSQEWEIRKSLGKELGLAPSEVNGWKDIYRSRAEQTRRQKASVQSEIDSAAKARDGACNAEQSAQSNVERLEKEVKELESKVAASG